MKKNKHLSFDIIVAAADGDKEAIKRILNFYDSYISKLSLRKMKNNVLKPISKDYAFSELLNPIYIKKGNQIEVSVSVKYLDQQTKATQISQFDLTIEKENNWIIVG